MSRMTRKLLAFLMSTVFIAMQFINVSYADSQEPIRIYFNGELVQSDVPAEISSGRTMVPLRVISEYFGAQVSWEENSQTVTVVQADTTNQLKIGEHTAQMVTSSDRSEIELDAAPYIKNERTMVPIRYLAESLGLKVEWDAEKRIVYIESEGANNGGQAPAIKYYYGDFVEMGRFSCGLAPVIDSNGKLGYIDTSGNLTIDFRFDAEVNNSDIDQPDFIYPNPAPYNDISIIDRFEFSEYGYAFVKRDGVYIYIDTKGNKIDNTFSGKYYSAGPFVNGRAAAQKTENGLLGYIDESGSEITEFKYLSAGNFKNGVARAIEAVPFINGSTRFEPEGYMWEPYYGILYAEQYGSPNPVRDKYMPKDKDVIDVYIDTNGSVLSWRLHERDGFDPYFRTGVIFELDELSQGLILREKRDADRKMKYWYENPNGTVAIEFGGEQNVLMAYPFTSYKIAEVICGENENQVTKYINNKGEFLDNGELAVKFPNLFRTVKSDYFFENGEGIGASVIEKSGEKYFVESHYEGPLTSESVEKLRRKTYLVDVDGRIISDCTELDKEIYVNGYGRNREMYMNGAGIEEYYDNINAMSYGWGWTENRDFNSNVYYIGRANTIHSAYRLIGFVVIEGWEN